MPVELWPDEDGDGYYADKTGEPLMGCDGLPGYAALGGDCGPDDPAQSSLLAAKRYRSEEHRTFHRSASYTEGRRTRRSRDARALAKKTAHGRAVAAGQ